MTDYIAFNIILDDIVCSDGTTHMGLLGGGGPQSAFGMKLWTDSVGLVSGVGSDLPSSVWQWLEINEIDINGIRQENQPTLRAWQVLESNGQRTQVWRVSPPAIQSQLQRSLDLLPDNYLSARGAHFGIHPLDPDNEFIQDLKKQNIICSLEPFRPAERTLELYELEHLIAGAQIFSPNLAEACSLIPTPKEISFEKKIAYLISNFLEAGAQIVSLRMGSSGSWIAGKPLKQIHHIPAVETSVIDPVGAGNAYCGGFLVGWIETCDPIQAGLYGAVSASYLVEQIGVPGSVQQARQTATARLEAIECIVESHPV